jgi:hypothetical protein
MVSERLGHTTIKLTLDTYGHVMPDDDPKAARTLAGSFGSADGSKEEVTEAKAAWEKPCAMRLFTGGPSWDRTRDLMLIKHAL